MYKIGIGFDIHALVEDRVLKLGGEVRNKHVTPSAETKFTQLLMLIKDQFSNWNANNGKDN